MTFLQGMVFYGPIATLYRQAQGISVLQITWIESVSLALCILLEIPWGMLADKIGYRRTMIICSFLYFLSKIIFWQATNLLMFLGERILLGIVMAGISGVDSSILYLSFDKERTHNVFGIYYGLGMAGLFAAAVLFSIFIQEDYASAAFLTVISYGGAMVLSFFLQEVKEDETIRKISIIHERKHLFQKRRMIVFLLAVALLSQTHQTITVFLNQVQYDRLGMSESSMGAIYILSACMGIFSVLSFKISHRMGTEKTILWFTLFMAGACVCLASAQRASAAVGAVLFIRVVDSLFQPLQLEIQNKEITEANRATRLSVNAMWIDGVGVITNLFFGMFSARSIIVSIFFGALLCLISAGLFFYFFHQGTSSE